MTNENIGSEEFKKILSVYARDADVLRGMENDEDIRSFVERCNVVRGYKDGWIEYKDEYLTKHGTVFGMRNLETNELLFSTCNLSPVLDDEWHLERAESENWNGD